MDIRTSTERVETGGLKRSLADEPAFTRLLQILKDQAPDRTEKLMDELEASDE